VHSNRCKKGNLPQTIKGNKGEGMAIRKRQKIYKYK
jgi:hypothetical protein